jgi:hypothetical protein
MNRARAADAHHNPYPFYAFRIWFGMVATAWLPLLARHRFAVSPGRILFVLAGIVTSLISSGLGIIQALIFAKRVRAAVLDTPPIFIIGHWRTGTTHLHELLTVDERFFAPTTLECLAPAQCLAFGWLLRTHGFILPEKRPMDDMPVGWDQPQEDEFALLNLGLGSPYETMIFPNHRQVRHPFLNLTDVAPAELEAWKAGFLGFLQLVNFRSRREEKCSQGARRIVLKSPTHTARLHVLLSGCAIHSHRARPLRGVSILRAAVARAVRDARLPSPGSRPDIRGGTGHRTLCRGHHGSALSRFLHRGSGHSGGEFLRGSI